MKCSYRDGKEDVEGHSDRGPHLQLPLFQEGLIPEVGQLGEPGSLLGPGPACAHLLL